MPVKIPTWDTSHLADERYEIAPGICTRCPTMNWDLYRGLYFSWTSQNRQILPGAEPGSCGAGTVETASGPGAGSGGGDCVPPRTGNGWEAPAELAQFAKQAPECKRRPIAGGKQRGNNSLSPGVSRFVTHRLKQGVSALHFPPKRWHNAQPQKEILRSKGLEGAALNKQTAGNVRVY